MRCARVIWREHAAVMRAGPGRACRVAGELVSARASFPARSLPPTPITLAPALSSQGRLVVVVVAISQSDRRTAPE